MSVQAITWALEDAPDVPARLVSTLIALANHAGRTGRGSFPGNDTLSEYTRKSVRQVKRDLEELVELRLISEGDQQLVAHMRADRRPRVWDLAMHHKRSRGVTHDTPSAPSGGTPETPREAERGDTDDTPQAPRGDIQGAHGVSPMTPEPKEEPKNQALPPTGVKRAAPAHMRPARVSPAELNATASRPGAWSLVGPWKTSHQTKYSSKTYRDIVKQVDLILADNGEPALVNVALHDWDARGKTPEFLRHCYDDAVHATRPAHLRPVVDNRPATTDVRASNALLLAEFYEAQERADQTKRAELPGMAS